MNHDSPADIRGALEAQGLSLKKRWGQNFLVNRGARERLIALLEIRPGDKVWEIGPGLGAMTELIARSAGDLTVFEIDRGLCRWLDGLYSGRPGFALVPGDFVQTWRDARDRQGQPDLLLGNLPYSSASLIIAALVEGELRPRRAVLTVQRELAERLTALPRGKSYSSFSVLCQACFSIERRGDLQPGSFYPVPEVVSSIVVLLPRPGAPRGEALAALSRLARGLFASRRKTIRNNAAGLKDFPRARLLAALEAEGIDPGQRAEQVPPEAWAAVARGLTRSEAP